MTSLTESFNPSNFTPKYKNKQNERLKFQWRLLIFSVPVVKCKTLFLNTKCFTGNGGQKTLPLILKITDQILWKQRYTHRVQYFSYLAKNTFLVSFNKFGYCSGCRIPSQSSFPQPTSLFWVSSISYTRSYLYGYYLAQITKLLGLHLGSSTQSLSHLTSHPN